MKLTASMMVTLDGVYQGPGGPDEDRRGGFDRGGWTAAHADEEGWRFLTSYFERADAFLLGRKTWEIWEPYWPHHDSGDPVSHGINVLPKYVPSTTLKDPAWQNTHVIDGDVEAAVRELKAKPGRELQVHGSGELLRWLLERDLVDELNLRIYPVVVGDGQILGKPDSEEGARNMLIRLSGKTHEVLTGLCVLDERQCYLSVSETKVQFSPLSSQEIEAYLKTGEPFGKAGAYAIQGYASRYVERIDGCYFNVVGLPISLLYQMLQQIGYPLQWITSPSRP